MNFDTNKNIKSLECSLLRMPFREFLATISIVFYITYTILINSEFVNIYQIKIILNIFLSCSMAISLCSIAFDYSDSRIAVTVSSVCAAILLVSAAASSSMNLIYGYIVLIACRGIRRQNLAKIILLTIILCMTIVIASSLFGIIPNTTIITTNALTKYSLVERRRLGFIHPNVIGGFVFSAFICWVYLRGKDLRKLECLMFLGVSAILYFFVNTKTSSILIAIASLILLIKVIINNNKLFNLISVLIIILSLLLAIFLPYMYLSDGHGLMFVNNLLSGRLALAAQCISDYDVTLFGQPIAFVSTNEAMATGARGFVVDNAFIHLLYHYGLLSTIIIILFYFINLYLEIKNNNSIIAILIAMVFICMIMENWFFNPAVNALLLLLSSKPDVKLSECLPAFDGHELFVSAVQQVRKGA